MDDRKSSTMSSIFVGSTLEKPNVELIINAVATILHSQMLEVSAKGTPSELPNLFMMRRKKFKKMLTRSIGHKLRQIDPVRERPVLFLWREVHLGEAGGLRQAKDCTAEGDTERGEHLRVHEGALRLRTIQVRDWVIIWLNQIAPSAASSASSISTDWSRSLRCPFSLRTGAHSSCAPSWWHKRSGMTATCQMRISHSFTPSS